MTDGSMHNPPGWHHNPSSPVERGWLSLAALVAAAIAAYLTLFQMGVIRVVWDPIFELGSVAVLKSSISRALPIPDAAVGCGAYLVDLVLILAGGRRRWQNSPWLVISNAAISGILGLTAIILIALQSFVVHAWCSLCLACAGISLMLTYFAGRELVATIQYLKRETRSGRNLWPLISGVRS